MSNYLYSYRCIWLYVIIMSRTSFRVNLHSIVCLNVKELLARSRSYIWSLSDSIRIRTHNHLLRKQTLKNLAKLAKWLSSVVVLWLLIYTVHLTVSYYYVTYEFQSDSTLYSFLECQRTPCLKQALYLKFKWQQWYSKIQSLSL